MHRRVADEAHRAACVADGLAQLGPVAVDILEVAAAVGRAALGVDLGVQVDAAGAEPLRVGLLPRQAHWFAALDGEPTLVRERAHVRQQARVEPRLLVAHEVRVHRESLVQGEARLGGEAREFLDLGPGALGVHVVGRER